MDEKKRNLRRTEVRRNEDGTTRKETTVASLQYDAIDPKLATKNPTRYVPDQRGFEMLTKQEIKRDIKDANKQSTFSILAETDSEDESEVAIASMFPPCAPDSTLYKKAAILKEWINNPDQINRDLRKIRNETNDAKKRFNQLEKDEERWVNGFDLGRAELLNALTLCREQTNQFKANYLLLLSLAISECSSSPKKRRSKIANEIKDVIEELNDRDDLLKAKIEAFESLVIESKEMTNNSHIIPQITMSFEELDYPEDKIIFDKMYKSNKNKNDESMTISNNFNEELLSMLNANAEIVSQSERSLYDIDYFFPEGDDNNIANSITEGQENWKCLPGVDWEKKISDPLLALNNQTSLWKNKIDEVLRSCSTIKRKRKTSGDNCVSLSSHSLSRTPYGIPIFISPLSQFEGNFLAYAPNNKGKISNIPIELLLEESKCLERGKLQSAAAFAETKLKRLKQCNIDWKRQVNESIIALDRATNVYNNVIQEDLYESRKIRKELIAFSIAIPTASEPPLSPIEEVKVVQIVPIKTSTNGGGSKGNLRKGASVPGRVGNRFGNQNSVASAEDSSNGNNSDAPISQETPPVVKPKAVGKRK